MSGKLELSWIGALKQWRKRRSIDGKRKDFYLGTGNGKADRESYERALTKWRVTEAQLNANGAQQKLEDAIAELQLEQRLAGSLVAKADIADQIKLLRDGASIEDTDAHRKLRAEVRRAVARNDFATVLEKTQQLVKDGPAPKEKTMGELIDEYLRDQQRRYEHGCQFPDAPQKKRISAGRLMAYRYSANYLRKDWGNEPLSKDEATLHALMKRFQLQQQDMLTAGTLMPNTYNERMKVMRHFLGWLHSNCIIDALPRSSKELCVGYDYKSSARAFDLPCIQRLWAGANNRFRLYMALALNCGYYAVDVANLELSHIQGDYIIADRHKTGVPTRYKLWGVTKRLLKQECVTTGRLALLTPDGKPLISHDMSRGNGKRWSKIDNDFAAIRKRLKIKGVSFSNFRDTSSTKVESINRALTDVFDAHKDRRMARRYIDHDRLDHNRLFEELDAAIDELERFYGLMLD